MTNMEQYNQFKSEYDREGFVIVPKFLPNADLAELTENINRFIREVVPTMPDGDAFYQDKTRPETLKQIHHMNIDPFFAEYRQHPRWLAFAHAMLGEAAKAKEPEWFNKPPETNHPTPPHQDNYYFCLEPPQVLTMWVALDKVDEENGCLRYVAGSHLLGTRTHGSTNVLGFSQGINDYGPDDTAKETIIRLERGDMACHHGQLIHRADPNRSSSRHRRSFAMVLVGDSAQQDEQRFARYIAARDSQHTDQGLKS